MVVVEVVVEVVKLGAGVPQLGPDESDGMATSAASKTSDETK